MQLDWTAVRGGQGSKVDVMVRENEFMSDMEKSENSQGILFKSKSGHPDLLSLLKLEIK